VFWTVLSVLLFVMVPTEVHERYLILVLPFLGSRCADLEAVARPDPALIRDGGTAQLAFVADVRPAVQMAPRSKTPSGASFQAEAVHAPRQ